MDWIELSLDEQLEYAKSEDSEEREHFARYPVLPEVAEYMVEHETDETVMEHLFGNLFRVPNNNIWASTLEKAAKKKVKICGVNQRMDYCLAGIALHLNTTVDTLKYLFTLNNSHINWALASNPNTPKVILEELSNCDNRSIDDALLHNPNTGKETNEKVWSRYPHGMFTCGSYYECCFGIKVEASGN